MPPVPRFRGIFTTPPTGFYEYEVEGERVQSTNRLDACTKVSDLRKKHGLPVVGDGMTTSWSTCARGCRMAFAVSLLRYGAWRSRSIAYNASVAFF